jgi:uncharacterized integral membrane protein (TIGR00698 family)
VVPGLAVAAAGLGLAMLGHRFVPQVGVLTWAVGLGVLASNLNLLPQAGHAGLARITKKLLRVGVALLGFSVSFAAIASLGVPVIALIAATLVGTLAFTTWLGTRMRLGGPRSLLIATGVSICGASAIAAMEETAGADEEDVTAAIAMITLFGTVALVAFPLLRGPLGLGDAQFAVWTGASVHEVGQVVAAASPAGAAVVATAVVVKLTRVLLLAPAVATVSVIRRFGAPASGATARRAPLVPLFVLGFLACAALRGLGVVPQSALGGIGTVQVAALGAALFGMGASVHLASLVKRSGALVALAAVATLVITGIALAGVLLLVRS